MTLRQCMWLQRRCHSFLRHLKSRSSHPANSSPSHPRFPQRRTRQTRVSPLTTIQPRLSTPRCRACTRKTERGRAMRVLTLANLQRSTHRAKNFKAVIAWSTFTPSGHSTSRATHAPSSTTLKARCERHQRSKSSNLSHSQQSLKTSSLSI